jgi:hypothetical protein
MAMVPDPYGNAYFVCRWLNLIMAELAVSGRGWRINRSMRLQACSPPE